MLLILKTVLYAGKPYVEQTHLGLPYDGTRKLIIHQVRPVG